MNSILSNIELACSIVVSLVLLVLSVLKKKKNIFL